MAVVLSIKGENKGKKKPEPKNEKGEFSRIASKKGKYWFAAMMLKGRYEDALDPEEIKLIKDLKKNIKKSKLEDDEKEKLAALLDGINTKDRWDASTSYDVVKKRINAKINAEHSEAMAESLVSWRKGKIAEFAKKYMEQVKKSDIKPELKHGITRLLMIGADKGGLSAATAVEKSIEHQHSEEKTSKKLEALEELSKIVIHI